VFGTQVLAKELLLPRSGSQRRELAGQARDGGAVCERQDVFKRRIGCSRYREHFRAHIATVGNLNNLIGTTSLMRSHRKKYRILTNFCRSSLGGKLVFAQPQIPQENSFSNWPFFGVILKIEHLMISVPLFTYFSGEM
jgi:hypothetical protein